MIKREKPPSNQIVAKKRGAPPKGKALTVDQIAKAIRANGGFITRTAEALGVSAPAISIRVSKSAKLQKVVRETEEFYLDLAESKLMGAINAGEPWAICFFLKCKGKKRGYVERQEIAGVTDAPIPIRYVKK